MKGVKFGSLHSFDEWGLILTKKEIGSPEVKEKKVDVEGADGELDLTEALGGIRYGNRKLKFEFQKVITDGFLTLISDIQEALHGKKLHVVLDEDPEYYYIGRITVSDFTQEKGICKVSLEVDAEPYKMEELVTMVSQEVSGTAEIMLANARKPAVPEITIDAAMTFVLNGKTFTYYDAGTYKNLEMELDEGVNLITATGTGKVIFSYRKGVL